jgi:hypothetical protein
MKRWRGDGLAAVAILVGAALAWFGTSMALASVAAGVAAMEAEPVERVEVEQVMASNPAGDGVAFRASSLNSGFSVQGDYGGRLTREGETLRLHIPQAMIRNSAVYGVGEARLAGIRLSLANGTASGWNIVRKGELHLIRDELQAGEALWLTDLVLEIEGVSEHEAMDRWLVIEHQLVEVDGSGTHVTRTYAHAPHELLALLFGWEEDGC